MNPNSAGDGVRCLSWNMDKLKESCKVNVTIPTVEPNTYYGITNCTKPGSPSGKEIITLLGPSNFLNSFFCNALWNRQIDS